MSILDVGSERTAEFLDSLSGIRQEELPFLVIFFDDIIDVDAN
jgi:hypothetical protein